MLIIGPPAFIGCYVLTAVAFVPALPMSVLGGLLFGPLWGTVYASIGSTLGACCAFLIARYAARDLVERWIATSPILMSPTGASDAIAEMQAPVAEAASSAVSAGAGWA